MVKKQSHVKAVHVVHGKRRKKKGEVESVSLISDRGNQ